MNPLRDLNDLAIHPQQKMPQTLEQEIAAANEAMQILRDAFADVPDGYLFKPGTELTPEDAEYQRQWQQAVIDQGIKLGSDVTWPPTENP